MQIKVNKDFLHEYKNELWKGFTLPEIASMAIGLSCDGLVVFLCWKFFHMSPANAVYLGMPGMIPALFIGFVRFQDNANLLEYAKAMYDTYQCRALHFCGERLRKSRRTFQMCRPSAQKGAKKGGRKR